MENMFEGVKFGDKFVTRSNYEAIYIETIQRAHIFHRLIVKNGIEISDIECTEEGIAQFSPECNNIVSKYVEPITEQNPCDECRWKERAENLSHVQSLSQIIDEEKLNEFAQEADIRMSLYKNTHGWVVDDYYREGFKAGYRKAKKEE